MDALTGRAGLAPNPGPIADAALFWKGMGICTTGSSSSESKLAILRSKSFIIGDACSSCDISGCEGIPSIGGNCPGVLFPLDTLAVSTKGSCLRGDNDWTEGVAAGVAVSMGDGIVADLIIVV